MTSATKAAERREDRLERMRADRARRRSRDYDVELPGDYDPEEPFPIDIPERMHELRGYPGGCCYPPMSARMPVIDSAVLQSLRGAGKKRKKKRSKGTGKWCVFSKKGKLVRCYEKKSAAHKVRKGFGRGFKVKRRSRASR